MSVSRPRWPGLPAVGSDAGRGPGAGPMRADPVSWRTASFGDGADTSPADLQTLGQHLSGCSTASGRLVAMRCAGGRVRGFMASHLVSTLVAALLLAALTLALL